MLAARGQVWAELAGRDPAGELLRVSGIQSCLRSKAGRPRGGDTLSGAAARRAGPLPSGELGLDNARAERRDFTLGMAFRVVMEAQDWERMPQTHHVPDRNGARHHSPGMKTAGGLPPFLSLDEIIPAALKASAIATSMSI